MNEIERRQIWVDHDKDKGVLSLHLPLQDIDPVDGVEMLMRSLIICYDPNNPDAGVTLAFPLIVSIEDLGCSTPASEASEVTL